MSAKARCQAVTMWHGERVRCTVMTAQRQTVVRYGPKGERTFSGEVLDVLRPAVCSRHQEWVASHGIAWIAEEVPA
jgi:hypothetical protein